MAPVRLIIQRSTSLLRAAVWTCTLLAASVSSHAIRRASLASQPEEPVSTIQTSMPPSPSFHTASLADGCYHDGSTIPCPTSTITASESGESDPVFCPAPTSLPGGLCYTTITYGISLKREPTATINNSDMAVSGGSGTSNATTTTSVRLYPCEEKTTIYSSATYAINCLDDSNNYIACPTSISIVAMPSDSSLANNSASASTTCSDEDGNTARCDPVTTSSVLAACKGEGCPSSTTISSHTYAAARSSIARTGSTITQCFDRNATPVSCPTLCSDPFETAPGPAIPTASLSLENLAAKPGSSTGSERIFRTSPAPRIASFRSAPAFLTSGLPDK